MMRYLENETSCLHPVTNTMVVFVVLDDLPSACGCLLATSTSTTIILCSLNTPIKGVVILVACTDEKTAEEFAKVRIIRFVVEVECTSVVEEDTKFIGETMAEHIGGGGHLLLHNVVVLLLLGSSLEPLPWEGTAEEVHQHVGKGFEIVMAGLLNTQMDVDVSVMSSSSQVFVLPVQDMKVHLWVPEFLCKTEINDIDLIAMFANAHEEVVGLDVSVNEVFGVNVPNM